MSATATETSGLKLYEIPGRLREIEGRIIDLGGEITPDVEKELDALEEAFERKVEYIALLSREAKAEAAAVKQEEDRLRQRRSAAENREKRLKDYLLACLVKDGRGRVEGDRVKVRVQANSRPSIWWRRDPGEAPEAYRRTSVSVDLNAAYEDLKAGAELPEGFEIERGSHLVVW